MSITTPTTMLDGRYGAPEAQPESWTTGLAVLDAALIYWISTVTPEGQPHVTPLIAVWHADALWFCTGEEEQKARNLVANPACTFTTGTNAYDHGLDVVMQGRAERETDNQTLAAVAEAYLTKYGEEWRFEVANGEFRGAQAPVPVFRVRPTVAHGFRRGDLPSQTRWTFEQ